MNEDIKTLWIDALETGLINGRPVEQTKEVLRAGDTYLEDGTCVMNACCLGVLTELAVDAGVVKRGDDMDGVFAYFDETEYGEEYRHEDEDLPASVCAWAGLDEHNPQVPYPNNGDTPLSILNDDKDESFASIAKYIKDYL